MILSQSNSELFTPQKMCPALPMCRIAYPNGDVEEKRCPNHQPCHDEAIEVSLDDGPALVNLCDMAEGFDILKVLEDLLMQFPGEFDVDSLLQLLPEVLDVDITDVLDDGLPEDVTDVIDILDDDDSDKHDDGVIDDDGSDSITDILDNNPRDEVCIVTRVLS